MKYDYDKYQGDALDVLYFSIFGKFFGVTVNDHTDHRQEIIDCIESGIPQDESTIISGWVNEHGVPGVDFVL